MKWGGDLVIGHGDDFGVVLSDLLVQQLDVFPRRQSLHLHGGGGVRFYGTYNMAHTIPLRPDSGLGFQVKVIKTL